MLFITLCNELEELQVAELFWLKTVQWSEESVMEMGDEVLRQEVEGFAFSYVGL